MKFITYFPSLYPSERDLPSNQLTNAENESLGQGLRNTLLTNFFNASHMIFSISCFSP